MFQIECHDVAKFFGKTEVFRNLNFRFDGSLCVGIQGPNGSGKSTLMKCLSGLLRPTKGHITWKENEAVVDQRMIRFHMGYAAPYLQLYNELSVSENLTFLRQIRSGPAVGEPPEHTHTFRPFVRKLPDLLSLCGLDEIGNQSLGTLSSGQQQRVRLAGALISSPPLLMLDEPGSNLDEEGHALVSSLINRQKKAGGMVFLASNRKEELALCDDIIPLKPKNKPVIP